MITSEKRAVSRLLALALCAAAGVAAVGAVSASAASVVGANAPVPKVPAPSKAARSVIGSELNGSLNWAGWAQSAPAGTFHAAADTWVVPTVTSTGSGEQFASDWVGIGGFSDGTVVQAGTLEANSNGTPVYLAWTEIVPLEAINPLELTIHPGDKVTTTVREIKVGVWKMTVADKTTKLTKSRTQAYTGSTHASVEAIHERPCMSPCNAIEDFLELAHTTNVIFDPGKFAVAIGEAPKAPLLNLTPSGVDHLIYMVNNAETEVIAVPSPPDTDNDGFTLADGSTQPSPPKS